MKRTLFVFILSFCFTSLSAQAWFVGWDTASADFRLDASIFQVNAGPWKINTQSALPEGSLFILTHPIKSYTAWQLDAQAIVKDRIGFGAGMDVIDCSMDERTIRRELPAHMPGYEASIDKTDHEHGILPFRGGYAFGLFHAGLLGFIPVRKLYLVPFADLLYNKNDNYPSVTVRLTEQATNTSFTRTYKYYNTSSNGYKLGLALRGIFNSEGTNNKHARIYMQARVEFLYLKVRGHGFYLDKDPAGNESSSTATNFSQDIYGFSVGFTLVGLDLHW